MAQNIQSSEALLEKAQESKLVKKMRDIRKKIMVMSGKGGVGKSTVAANLAARLAERGYRVGLLDADIHGPSIPKMLGIEDERPNVGEDGIIPIPVTENLVVMSIALLLEDKDSPVIWRGPAKMAAIKQFLGEVAWGKLDYLIIDLPPGTGDEPLSIAQLIEKLDGAVVVTTPQDVALLSVRKSLKFASILKVPVIGIVENMGAMRCPHCNEKIYVYGVGGVEKAAADFNVDIIGELPIEPAISEIEDLGKVQFEGNNRLEWFTEFNKVVDRVENFTK
ncbi:MAG: Mrp/NBP35 family ATP-binding protein [Methanosarcinaceae archaeon]|nr:Mrp/NBP35 family ATP-binding protein [Methanosarcinaceae archaeon]